MAKFKLSVHQDEGCGFRDNDTRGVALEVEPAYIRPGLTFCTPGGTTVFLNPESCDELVEYINQMSRNNKYLTT